MRPPSGVLDHRRVASASASASASWLSIILLLHSVFSTKVCSSPSVIESLPGFPGKLPFKLETGYIGVGDKDEVQLFYYFIKSEGNPEEDPLVLWLNGGPGCSSLFGLIHEIGPFTIDYARSYVSIPVLKVHKYSWTKVSNIIFLDQPVGTGFSYANTSKGYKTSDTLAAKHTHHFLTKWLLQHPKYIANPLYISGDSYSGIVVPLVVNEVYKGIEEGIQPQMNIKGYTLGNPLTDSFIDWNGRIEYVYKMGILSKSLYKSAKRHCRGNYLQIDPGNVLCKNDVEKIQRCVERISDSHILDPWCVSTFQYERDALLDDEIPSNFILKPTESVAKSWCREDNYVFLRKWANDKSVQKALHIRELSMTKNANSDKEQMSDDKYHLSLSYFLLSFIQGGTITKWSKCNSSLSNVTANREDPMAIYSSDVTTVVDYHRDFSHKSCRALIYSGDHDMKIPHTSTEKWIHSLNLSIQSDWRPWFVDEQFGGYTMKYAHGDYELTYATLRGAGHTAPEYTPKECLAMIRRWFQQRPL